MENSDLSFRATTATPTEGNKFQALASDETPVKMPDFVRGMMIDEIILTSGVKFPTKTGKVPLLDSHARSSVKNIQGSAYLRLDGEKVLADFEVSASEPDTITKLQEKHITDVSIGYFTDKTIFVPEGKTQSIRGKTYTGPVNVVTQSRIVELSLTPIGANSSAKIRSSTYDFCTSTEISQERGVDTNSPLINGVPSNMEPNETEKETNNVEINATPVVETRTLTEADVEALVNLRIEKFEEAAKLQQSIRSECVKHGLGESAEEISSKCQSLAEARGAILDLLATRQAKVSPYFGSWKDGAEKQSQAMRSGLMVRAFGEKNAGELAQGWQDYRYSSLSDLARADLECRGIRTTGKTVEDICRMALGMSGDAFARRDAGYNTPGSFPNLLADVQNKSLAEGYQAAPTTWQYVSRIGNSVSNPNHDVKRMRLNDIGSLDVWADNTEANEALVSDNKESYKIERFGKKISFSWATILGDDLGAFSRIPAMLGAAAATSINQNVWSLITSNAVLHEDNVACFHSGSHRNVGTTGVPSSTTFGELRKLLRLQTGPNGMVLNLVPKFVVCPAALENSVLTLVRSATAPDANIFGAYNNNFGLQAVVEPILDGNSSTAYYMFCDPSQQAGIEVTFLSGYESPRSETMYDPKTGSYTYQISQVYGFGLVDYRFAAKNSG
jgi:hypothetical protein